jgi:uncharacterized protein YyaL (SSP411 family)
MTRNRLDQEASPYLQQHRDNPVHWQPWDRAALDLATRTKKPILLSIGYAACHWCHVMAHESFEDGAIARVMNELFVNIKVDREERPDLDGIYQHALALLGQQGGWPLTMFLTPAGEPFWGGTYFPPNDRYGRPGFPDVLRSVSSVYREDPEKIAQNVSALRDALRRLEQPRAGLRIPEATVITGTAQLLGNIDRDHGGLAGAPKFPQPSLMRLLWSRWHRADNHDARRAVLHSLNRMLQGGIYDHIGGGLARYSVDAHWLVPHFEKMLYDNAQLLELLAWAWQDTRDPLFRVRAEEIIAWINREMRAAPAYPGGPRGFASSLDADSEGEEGRFYVWQPEEINGLLGPDALLFRKAYGISDIGNWEGKAIPNRSHASGLPDNAEEAILERCRAKLLAARENRVRPGWDDKVLTDWNGLMIAGLARASFAFDREDWFTMAREAFRFISETMLDGGLRYHSWRNGTLGTRAMIDDHAQMARAALALYEVCGDPSDLQAAQDWSEDADTRFAVPQSGGYFQTDADVDDVILRPKTCMDGATPAGNAVMAEVHARLYHLTGKTAYREKAAATIAAFTGDIEKNFFGLPALIIAQDCLEKGRLLVIAGPKADPRTQRLLAAARRISDPALILLQTDSSNDFPSGHPLHGKGRESEPPAAYLCQGATCSLPETEAEGLAKLLAIPSH